MAADFAQAQPAAGDKWPTRPIRFIVPFTAGSSSDIVARIVGQKLGERLGQSLVVDNRVGASGNIGTEAVARADARRLYDRARQHEHARGRGEPRGQSSL